MADKITSLHLPYLSEYLKKGPNYDISFFHRATLEIYVVQRST